MRRFRRIVPAVLAVGLSLTLVACSKSGGSGGTGGSGGGKGDTRGVHVTVTPKETSNVGVLAPIEVHSERGTLDTVTLTNDGGKEIKGALAEDKTSWKSTEPLGYDKKYTVKVSATGVDGKKADTNHQFSTLKPSNLTLPYLTQSGNYGVGQPVVVRFDEPIPDKAAAEKALVVATTPPVEGRWHWFDDKEVHFRPNVEAGKYWPAGTKVTVTAKVYGLHLGNGLYGQEDRSATLNIGRSKIAIADDKTHTMTVYIDGKQVRNIPVSMGKGGTTTGANGQTIDFWTRSGPHVVMGKAPVVRMTSASYGITNKNDPNYYDEQIKLAVHISGAGEYVHLADWNIPAHGVRNESHGCINVAPAHIYWFYENFGPGDIVDVRGTPKQLDPRDGLGDWTLSWADWVKGSALPA